MSLVTLLYFFRFLLEVGSYACVIFPCVLDDFTCSAAEFVLYKLKEMGKITQQDISLVMEEFEELDVDQSGSLSVSDIKLAQSPPPNI